MFPVNRRLCSVRLIDMCMHACARLPPPPWGLTPAASCADMQRTTHRWKLRAESASGLHVLLLPPYIGAQCTRPGWAHVRGSTGARAASGGGLPGRHRVGLAARRPCHSIFRTVTCAIAAAQGAHRGLCQDPFAGPLPGTFVGSTGTGNALSARAIAEFAVCGALCSPQALPSDRQATHLWCTFPPPSPLPPAECSPT